MASPEGHADAFPYDRMQWNDSDGDGFGDTPIGNKRDDCPNEAGTSTLDNQGCPDANGDGWSDGYGELNAAFASLSDDPAGSWLTYALLGAAAAFGIIVGIFFRDKPEDELLETEKWAQAEPETPSANEITETQPELMTQPDEQRGVDATYGGEINES